MEHGETGKIRRPTSFGNYANTSVYSVGWNAVDRPLWLGATQKSGSR